MLIFSHRGVEHDGADENSVKAFCHALEHGIDGIELDIRVTRDGIPVLVHDRDLRRIAGNSRRVESLLLKDLREIPLRRGSTIAELDDVTACIPAPVLIDIELKDEVAFHVVARKLSTSKSLRSRAIISSFHRGVIELAAKELPDVKTFLLVKRWPVRPERFAKWASEMHVRGIGLAHPSWRLSRIAWVKKQGMWVVAWEPFRIRSTSGRARKLIRNGIDVAIVNQPKVYLDAVKERGMGDGVQGLG